MMSKIIRRSWFKECDSGIALVLAVGIIAILTVMALDFQRSNVLEKAMAINFEHSIESLAVARSGVQIAMALLTKDSEENDYDSFFDRWGSLGESSEELKKMFPGVEWHLEVIPIEAWINVNKLVDKSGQFVREQKDLWLRLLNSGKLQIGDAEPEDILNCIKDWIDKDDQPTGFGAEDDYYVGLSHPYHCKNGPLQSVDEMLMIKGITPELFYGDSQHAGLKSLVSVYGSGKININVAPPSVMESLAPDIDEDMLEDFIAYRNDPSHEEDLKDPSWYKNVTGWGTVELPQKLVTTRSEYFKVKSSSKVGYSTRVVEAVVHRGKTKMSIVRWQVY